MSDIIRCTILSVHDTTILYPSCLKCFSRVTLTSGSNVNEQSSRWRCVKCGRDVCSVGYRYRLALRVSRDCDLLGVTVFGSSLDYFFGAPAGQLHRYLSASRESRGVPMTEGFLRRALDDCFVGRPVLLAVKLPGNSGALGYISPVKAQCPAAGGWPDWVRGIPEQHTASKMTVAQEGVFGATVLQYLESLQRVCVSGEREGLQRVCVSAKSECLQHVCVSAEKESLQSVCVSAESEGLQRVCVSGGSEHPQDASLDSDQASYHDYTRLCPGGSCWHSGESAASSSFCVPGLRSPGLRSDSVDSLEPSVSEETAQMPRTDDSDVSNLSVAVATWSCCDSHHGYGSQESGYSDAASRDDREELSECFSSASSSLSPAESLTASFSQSVFLDELLAHAFPTSFTSQNLSAESLSGSSGSRGSSGGGSSRNHECPLLRSHYSEPAGSFDCRANSSETAGSFDSRVNSSEPAGSFESPSDSSTSTPEALVSDSEEGSYNCSAELFDDVSGLDRKDTHQSEAVRGRPHKSAGINRLHTPVCHLFRKSGRPRTPVCPRLLKSGRPLTPVCLRSIKPVLAPVSQSTPILSSRAAPEEQRLSRVTEQHRKTPPMGRGPSYKPHLQETGSEGDGQIEYTSKDESSSPKTAGQIECRSIDAGGQIEYTDIDAGDEIEYTNIDEGDQIEYTNRNKGDQIECISRNKDCCDATLAFGLLKEDANWSKDLFVDSYNE